MVGNLDDDSWVPVSLTSSLYGSTPLVFATTQTTNGAQEPSQAHVRGVSTSGFETQHCEVEGPDDCDIHNAETNGWIALDEASVDAVDGMDAGTLTITDEDYQTVTFAEGFSSPPYVFVQVQTEAGLQNPRNVQVTRVTSDQFTVQFCEHELADACDTTHQAETVAWWAIDPSQASKGTVFDWGTVAVQDSNWGSITYDFPSTPVVLAMPQTQNGVQEALYGEARSVSSTGAEVRFCEYDMDDTCDAHTWESVAWLAVGAGDIVYEEGSTLVAEFDQVERSSGGPGDTGTLATFAASAGAPLTVTYKYCYLADTNTQDAIIRTLIDGTIEDTFSFRTPFTGDGSCTGDEPTTYGARAFTLNRGVSSEIRFDYENGDWRLFITDISVNAEGGESDADGDGLSDVEENVDYRTDPFTADTDDDELSDLDESDQFPHRDIFCGSVCEHPDPITRDAYLEVDGWETCIPASGCAIYGMSDSVRDTIESRYSAQGINLHIDNGKLGGGDQTIQEFSEDFDHADASGWMGSFAWNELSGLWHLTDDCEKAPSIAYALAYTQDSTCTYDTGSTTQGNAWFEVDLTSTFSPTLTFDHTWETESESSGDFDIMRVQASTDGGSSWDTVARWDSSDPNQGTWQPESLSLEPYAGSVVDIRFSFDSVDSAFNSFKGWFIDNLVVAFNQTSQNWITMNWYYEDNPNYFDMDRQGIFHHMVWVRYLDDGACGTAATPGPFSLVAEEDFRDGDGDCGELSGPAITDTTMEEFGHNDLGIIEGGDHCDPNEWPDQYETHDKHDSYVIECGVFADLDDFHSNRWKEYKEPVASPDPNFGGDTDSGDLGNGLK